MFLLTTLKFYALCEETERPTTQYQSWAAVTKKTKPLWTSVYTPGHATGTPDAFKETSIYKYQRDPFPHNCVSATGTHEVSG